MQTAPEPGKDRPGQHALRDPKPRIGHAPTIYQARLASDLLRESGNSLAELAAKLRKGALADGRNGTPRHVTEGRLATAEAHDDHAGELFALADWIERSATTGG